jgi:hypothetical protein
MAVRNKGVLANDPEVRERADVIGQRVGPAETSVQLVDLFDREHEPKLSLDVRSEERRTVPKRRESVTVRHFDVTLVRRTLCGKNGHPGTESGARGERDPQLPIGSLERL